jgi:hypothetical protein
MKNYIKLRNVSYVLKMEISNKDLYINSMFTFLFYVTWKTLFGITCICIERVTGKRKVKGEKVKR